MSQNSSTSENRPVFDKALAEAIGNLEIPNRVRFSPDGQRVLYSTSLPGGLYKGERHVSTLWLASASEPGSSRQLTSGLCNDSRPTWHPDGKHVVFLSDRAKPGNSSAIWIMSLDGGDPTPVLPSEDAVSTFIISPDGETIAYLSADSKDDKSGQGENLPGPNVWGDQWEYARLRLVNIQSKDVKTLVAGNKHVTDIAWSPDGKSLAFGSRVNPEVEEGFLTGTTISTIDVDSAEVRELRTVKNEILNLSWAADGKLYFMTGIPETSDLGGYAVYAINPAEDSPELIKVDCGASDQAEGLTTAGARVLVRRADRFDTVISTLDETELIIKKTGIGAWDVFFDPSGAPTLAASFSTINKPHEVYIMKTGQDDVQLSHHGKALDGRTFGSCTILTCPSADGEVEIDGMYITPSQAGDVRKPLPTFVMIHGGPTDHTCEAFAPDDLQWAPYILSRGYGVLLPQYRGSTGRGSKFALYSIGGQGKYDYDDVITITDHAITKGYADRENLLVGGWSNGGFLSYLCSVRNGLHGHAWRFNAVIAGAGICDVDSMAITSDTGATNQAELNGWLSPWTLGRDDTRGRQGSALWEVAVAVEESRRLGKAVIPPMLILHGEQDQRCPFSQAQGFRRALRHHGLPCEFVGYPGEGHVPQPQRFWLDMLERVSRWCDTYINPGMRDA